MAAGSLFAVGGAGVIQGIDNNINGVTSARIAPGITVSDVSILGGAGGVELKSKNGRTFRFATTLHRGESAKIQLRIKNESVSSKCIQAEINEPTNVRVGLSTSTECTSVVQTGRDVYQTKLPGGSSPLPSEVDILIDIQIANDSPTEAIEFPIRIEPLSSNTSSINTNSMLPTVYQSEFDYDESPLNRGWIALSGSVGTRNSALVPTSNSPLVFRDLGKQIQNFNIKITAVNNAFFGGLRINFFSSEPQQNPAKPSFAHPSGFQMGCLISQRSGNKKDFPPSKQVGIQIFSPGEGEIFADDEDDPAAEIILQRGKSTSPVRASVDGTEIGELDVSRLSIRYIVVNIDTIGGFGQIDSLSVRGCS